MHGLVGSQADYWIVMSCVLMTMRNTLTSALDHDLRLLLLRRGIIFSVFIGNIFAGGMAHSLDAMFE